jgi:hypothetical protein
MGTNKNSCSTTAASPARPPQTPHAQTSHLPFRNAGVPPALLQPPIPAPASPYPQFLIANPQLESPTTPTKQTIEARSNRKKIAILRQEFRLSTGGSPHPSLPSTHHQISNRDTAIRIPRNSRQTHHIAIPNRDKKAIFDGRVVSLACKPPA